MKRATSARPGGRNPANVLLLKDDVGQPKPTTHALPRYGHTYGKAEARDAENAAAGKYLVVTEFLNLLCLNLLYSSVK
jgi:hypothetical protein